MECVCGGDVWWCVCGDVWWCVGGMCVVYVCSSGVCVVVVCVGGMCVCVGGTCDILHLESDSYNPINNAE